MNPRKFATLATITFLIGSTIALLAATTIEVPLAINNVYLKRLPGNFEFFYVGRLPGSGKLIALPESEIARFLKLAEENRFKTFLPETTAVKEVATATITVQETGVFQFYRSNEGFWIQWNEEPAPTILVDGKEVETFGWIEVPLAPQGVHSP